MANLFKITGKVVAITGGTGVLGRAIAEHLAEEGAKGGEAMFLVTTVLDTAVLEQNLTDILQAYERVDALLNAAGGNMPGATIEPTGTFFDLKIEEFSKVLELNLTRTVLPTQIFLKPMVEQANVCLTTYCIFFNDRYQIDIQ